MFLARGKHKNTKSTLDTIYLPSIELPDNKGHLLLQDLKTMLIYSPEKLSATYSISLIYKDLINFISHPKNNSIILQTFQCLSLIFDINAQINDNFLILKFISAVDQTLKKVQDIEIIESIFHCLSIFPHLKNYLLNDSIIVSSIFKYFNQVSLSCQRESMHIISAIFKYHTQEVYARFLPDLFTISLLPDEQTSMIAISALKSLVTSELHFSLLFILLFRVLFIVVLIILLILLFRLFESGFVLLFCSNEFKFVDVSEGYL